MRIRPLGADLQLHRPETEFLGLDRPLDQDSRVGLEIVALGQQRRVGRDRIVDRATQQLPARLALRLAAQIPQGHVEGAHGTDAEAAPPGHGGARIHLVPQALDVGRILSHQHFGQAEAHDVGTGRFDHRARDPRIGIGLANADQAFVRMYLHHQIVLRRGAGIGTIIRHQQDEAFDLGDLHTAIPSCFVGGQSARAFSCSRVRWHRNPRPPPPSRQGGRSVSQMLPTCHGHRPA